ncbi:class I SAM-dependent methyltransferase [Patescibacteria group bacterium]|nr:class I SAM-dependent methyltransferase [Patescibacteria group bacterium]
MRICKVCAGEPNIIFRGLKDLEYNIAGRFDFYKCQKCGLIFMDSVPDEKTLASFYPLDYHGYNKPQSKLTNFLVSLNLKSRANFYKKLIGQGGKILDVGSSEGGHFEKLSQIGKWDFFGVEFKEEIAQKGRQAGRNIETATIETCTFANGQFDLIIMNHLIEHVFDPVATMQKAAELLKDDGYVVGETPNTDSLDFKIFKKYWGGMHVPRHTYLFSPNSLKILFEKNGLTLKAIFFSPDTSHWSVSAQNFLRRNKTGKKIKQGRTKYYPFLLLAFLPLNLIQKILGKTGIIRFVARKENAI